MLATNEIDNGNGRSLFVHSLYALSPILTLNQAPTATTTRLNEQILSRAASAMTASTLAAVAARVESATDGIGGSGKPLAFELDGRSSLHALLEKNGKAMLEDTMDYQRLLDGASFVLPLPLSALSATGNAPTGNPGKTAVWGSGDFRNLADNNEDDLDWEGKTLSAHLGIDKRLSEQTLAGLALSWNDASFDYKDDADNSTNPTPARANINTAWSPSIPTSAGAMPA